MLHCPAWRCRPRATDHTLVHGARSVHHRSGDASFRKALAEASKKSNQLYPFLAGPTLLLNLPRLLGALVKVFKPLFPATVQKKLKFEQVRGVRFSVLTNTRVTVRKTVLDLWCVEQMLAEESKSAQISEFRATIGLWSSAQGPLSEVEDLRSLIAPGPVRERFVREVDELVQ